MTFPRARIAALTFGAVLLFGTLAKAAPPGPRDPDWPCQQIKVPQLSLAAVWAGPPVDPQQVDWQHDPSVADLVDDIAQRRVLLLQAQAKIRAFAAQQAEAQKQQKLVAVLAGLFNVLDAERSAVIAGLDRFGARQQELAAEIRQNNEKLRQMQADSAADTSQVNQMVQRVTWEAEVFQDRRQSLSYACDVPGKIEQRLFALARTIQQNLD
ncbi:MAG TPA: hypothetical protein VHX39_02700 [Acetobacteraceae bacterium]|nr:hypothetical protein [Acetobacteraceae bacterium]